MCLHTHWWPGEMYSAHFIIHPRSREAIQEKEREDYEAKREMKPKRSHPVSINWSIRNGIWTDRQTPDICKQPKCPKGLWFSGWWLNLGGFVWVSVLSPSIQESLRTWHPVIDSHGWSIKQKSIAFLHPLSFSFWKVSLPIYDAGFILRSLDVLGWGYLC